MPSRFFLSSALCLAAAVAAVPIGAGAWAQTAGADDTPRPLETSRSDSGDSNAPSATSGPTRLAPALPEPATASDLRANPSASSSLRSETGTEPTTTPTPDDPDAPNYGKPRPKKAKLFRPNPKISPPLPPLVPYRGAPGLTKAQLLNPSPAPKDMVDAPVPAPTVAVIPSPERARKPIVEDDPYAPTGIAAGTLRLLPFVETSTGYETNPNQVSGGVKASPVLRAESGLDVKSDFSTHSLTASLRGGYTDYPRNTNANRPDASGTVNGRVDVTRDDKIDVEGRFALATQTPGSPLLAVPGSVFITNRPTIVTDGTTLGATHTFNRLSVGLRGTFDRTQYGDATQSDGTLYRYSQDNYNDYGVVGRASYELTPALIPFGEIGYDSRARDNAIDLSGYARSSTGLTAKAGSTFEFTRLLTGTASAGYAQRHYADKRLTDLRGPTVDGSLIYTISPITTATLRANTFLSETTLAGAAGAISRSVSLELSHVFFRNFTLSGIGTYQVNEYQGVSVNESFKQGTVKATYGLNRDVQIFASATYQRLDSSLQGSSFNDATVLLGMRLQR